MQLAVSVDLDEIRHYRAIHGLAAIAGETHVYSRALARLADWARSRNVPLTWFVVGADAELAENAEVLRGLALAGDEIGNHSYSHHYDLTQRSAHEMKYEVERANLVIERFTGVRPRGFRAPGYVVTDTLLDLLREAELSYDSSVFPCPAYYAVKAGALAAMAARRRQSRAIVGDPDALRAPTVPYRVGRPYWFRGSGIWELPIQVTPRARLPFIGTSLTLAGATGARLLARSVAGERFVTLELHGLDALDDRDGLKELAKVQRDLRISWPKKLDAIDAAVEQLRNEGYGCVPMAELARQASQSR